MKILIAIEITSLVYTLVIAISYFVKKRIKAFDVELFKYILISTILGFIIEILTNASALMFYETAPEKVGILSKVYLCHYVIYMGLILAYVVCKAFRVKLSNDADFKKYARNILIIIGSLVLISVIGVFLVSGTSNFDGTWYYGTGNRIYILVAWFVITFLTTQIMFIVSFKKLNSKEKITFISILGLIIALALVRKFWPYFTINNTIFSLLTITLYFTIENPDINIINKLAGANTVKQDFLSSMSHELKTPLNIILGLSNNPSNDLTVIQNDMRNINIEAMALTEIFGNIIDVNMLESDHLEINEREYNIKEVLTALINEYNRRLSQKGVELKCYCDSMIPKKLIGDYEKILNATRKIMSNAAKFTEKGSITINIGGEIKKDTYLLRIEVKDTGKGIDKENFDAIFAEFGKSASDINSSTSGIGLGLTICKSLVYAMKGKILMGSEPGIGSTFVIEVPQKIAGTITVDQQIKSNNPSEDNKDESTQMPTPTPTGKLTALIVDDNALNIKVGKKLLENAGMEVVEASSADECLRILNEGKKFNYIFMDIMMPEKDGVICMHEIRYLDLPYVPIIVALTADSAMGSKERYLKDGFDDYIAKPLTPEEITRVIKKD